MNADVFVSRSATTPGGSVTASSWKITDEIVLQKTPEFAVVSAGSTASLRSSTSNGSSRSNGENVPQNQNAPLVKITAKHQMNRKK